MRKHAKTCESISSGRKFPIVVDAPPTPERVRSCLCSCSAGICVAVPSSTRGVHDTRHMLPGIHLGSRSRRKVRSLESCTPAELHATIVNVDELCSTFKFHSPHSAPWMQMVQLFPAGGFDMLKPENVESQDHHTG